MAYHIYVYEYIIVWHKLNKIDVTSINISYNINETLYLSSKILCISIYRIAKESRDRDIRLKTLHFRTNNSIFHQVTVFCLNVTSNEIFPCASDIKSDINIIPAFSYMRILAADQSGMRRSRGSRGRILNIGNMPLIPHPSLPLPWKNFLGPRMSKSGCFWFMIWTNLRNKLEIRSAPRLWLNHSYTVVFLHSSSNKHTNCFVEMKFSASFFSF